MASDLSDLVSNYWAAMQELRALVAADPHDAADLAAIEQRIDALEALILDAKVGSACDLRTKMAFIRALVIGAAEDPRVAGRWFDVLERDVGMLVVCPTPRG
jgi:hypothetical protein